MSQENMEIVRSIYAAWERGDFGQSGVFDPGIRVVWLPSPEGEGPETVGLEGMGRAMKDWMESWEQVTTAAEQLIDAGDQVVVIAEWRGLGKTSGVFTKWRYGAVYTLREGKVTSIISYTDPAAALEAVGLEKAAKPVGGRRPAERDQRQKRSE
jgi:ketosteroid isomerase-like protein